MFHIWQFNLVGTTNDVFKRNWNQYNADSRLEAVTFDNDLS